MRYLEFMKEFEAECKAVERDPNSILVLPISKASSVEDIREVYDQGARGFGENRPDALLEKAEALKDRDIDWHFIGNIQSRRIKDIVKHSSLIHSLASAEHAHKIDAVAKEMGKIQDVLIEVNQPGEPQKLGIRLTELAGLLRDVKDLDNIRVCGLMCMAPMGVDEATIQGYFWALGTALERSAEILGDKAKYYKELSMGMSQDWQNAVFCGSTIIRIGTAIFSD